VPRISIVAVVAIRFLPAEDAADWSRLRLEALERDPAAFSSSIEEHKAMPIEEVRKRLSGNPHSFVVGAFEDVSAVWQAFIGKLARRLVTREECGACT
jgi:hypothetical protein